MVPTRWLNSSVAMTCAVMSVQRGVTCWRTGKNIRRNRVNVLIARLAMAIVLAVLKQLAKSTSNSIDDSVIALVDAAYNNDIKGVAKAVKELHK